MAHFAPMGVPPMMHPQPQLSPSPGPSPSPWEQGWRGYASPAIVPQYRAPFKQGVGHIPVPVESLSNGQHGMAVELAAYEQARVHALVHRQSAILHACNRLKSHIDAMDDEDEL